MGDLYKTGIVQDWVRVGYKIMYCTNSCQVSKHGVVMVGDRPTCHLCGFYLAEVEPNEVFSYEVVKEDKQ